MLARVLPQYFLKITCLDFNSRWQMGRKKLKRKSKKKIAPRPGKQSQSSKSAPSMDALSRAVEYYRSGRLQEAAALCDGLLQENPDNPAALHLLGVIAFQRGENKAAVELIEKAIEINPSDPEFYNNLGLVFTNTGKSDTALEHFHKGLELKPDFADAYSNLGTVLKDQERFDEAIECYRNALELKPDFADAYSNLGNVLKDQGNIDEALENYHQALKIKPDYALAHSKLLLSMHYDISSDVSHIFSEHQRWAKQHASTPDLDNKVHANDRSSDRLLRIGYVSPDFRRHSVAFFFEPILTAHNRNGFEIICYPNICTLQEKTLKSDALIFS